MTGWPACGSADWINVRGVLPALFITLFTLVFLLSLTGFQVTGETAGPRLLGRVGASLIEVDRWLPAHAEELQFRAQDRPNATVHLPDLPIAAEMKASQVAGAPPDVMRDRVIQAMGMALYEHGTDALRNDSGAVDLGVDEPVRWVTTFLDRNAHGYWLPPLLISGLLVLGLCLDFIRIGRSPLSLILVGSVMSTFFAVAAWLLATAGARVIDSGVDKEVMLIARDGAFMGLRNSVAVAAASIALMLVMRVTVQQPHRAAVRRRDREEETRPV